MNLLHRGILTGVLLSCSVMLPAKEFAARLNYRICVPDQPAAIEVNAAEELAAYLNKTYTQKVRLNGSDKPILFSVGFAPEAKEFSKAKDAFKESGFGVFCKNRTILLTGYDDPNVKPYSGFEEGTLLSVYYFLRQYTGLKIYAPDPVHGEKVGKNTALKVPAADKPVFSFSIRDIGKNFADYSVQQMNVYSRKQLCHDFYWSNHNVYYLVLNRWGKRFKNQPEMLGLYYGKRQSVKYPYHIPCLTNPKVKEVIVNDILAMIRKQKVEDRAVLRVFCDAPFSRCECANCARIATNDDYFYGFIVSVWDAVKVHYPKTRLFLQEKGTSHSLPPATGNLKNVVVDIATGYPAKGDYMKKRELFRKWQKRGALPTIRLYARYPQWLECPLINPHDIAANFRAMHGYALGQRRSDCRPKTATRKALPYSFAALTNYVHVNTLLNVNADTDELIRDFCSFMYPGAAKEMIEFYRWMEKRSDNLSTVENPYLKCYAYDALEYPLSLLNAAAKKCTDPFWLNKLRVAFDEFRENAKSVRHLTVNLEKNRKVVAQRRADFRKNHYKPFNFTATPTVFPLCPLEVPLDKIQDTTVRVHTVNDRLVFQFTAMEERIDLLKRTATADTANRVWGDDCFEVMIAPNVPDKPYLQVGINPDGTVATLWNARSGPRFQPIMKKQVTWKASAKIGKDRWTAELSLPLSLIREICPDGKGRIGIFRTRVLADPNPDKRSFYIARAGLYGDDRNSSNHHDLTRYRPFTFK